MIDTCENGSGESARGWNYYKWLVHAKNLFCGLGDCGMLGFEVCSSSYIDIYYQNI